MNHFTCLLFHLYTRNFVERGSKYTWKIPSSPFSSTALSSAYSYSNILRLPSELGSLSSTYIRRKNSLLRHFILRLRFIRSCFHRIHLRFYYRVSYIDDIYSSLMLYICGTNTSTHTSRRLVLIYVCTYSYAIFREGTVHHKYIYIYIFRCCQRPP